jgi:hypothetical protein
LNAIRIFVDEEIFGPVAAVISVKNEKQAIQVDNDSTFSLARPSLPVTPIAANASSQMILRPATAL